jgi:hypothetical protein
VTVLCQFVAIQQRAGRPEKSVALLLAASSTVAHRRSVCRVCCVWALFGLNRLDEAEKIAHEASIRDPKLALAHLLLANIYNRRSDCSAMLVELDAYLRLEPDGPLSDQVREAQEYAKRKLAGSVVIIEAAQAKP